MASAKKPTTHISHKDWSDQLMDVQLDKTDLNRLVLDYLTVEGYRDAAEEFVRESGVLSLREPEGEGGAVGLDDGERPLDPEAIEERMYIRQAVESGRVDEAVRRVNELEPEILDSNPSLFFSLQLLHLASLLHPTGVIPSSNSTNTSHLPSALRFATSLTPLAASSPALLAQLEATLASLLFPPPADEHAQRCKEVARELNGRILEAQGRGVESRLGGMLRLLSWGERRLEEKGVVVPRVKGVWREDGDGEEGGGPSADMAAATDENEAARRMAVD